MSQAALASADSPAARFNRRIGNVLVAQGNLAGALQAYEASLEVRQTLANSDPDEAGWQHALAVSYSKIGKVHEVQGRLPEHSNPIRRIWRSPSG